MTNKQKELKKKHGTPAAFKKAVYNAIGEITIGEAWEAIDSYKKEWDEAGKL